MSTQALLGMPVKVLQYTGWYEIQTPDDYTGWVHRMVITPMSKERYNEWNRAEKIVVTAHYGFTYEKPDEKSQTVSDVVAGNRLKWEGSKGHFIKSLIRTVGKHIFPNRSHSRRQNGELL